MQKSLMFKTTRAMVKMEIPIQERRKVITEAYTCLGKFLGFPETLDSFVGKIQELGLKQEEALTELGNKLESFYQEKVRTIPYHELLSPPF